MLQSSLNAMLPRPHSKTVKSGKRKLTTNAYCMSTVRLQPERIVMELIADSWASACSTWMVRKAMVEALTTSYDMTADVT